MEKHPIGPMVPKGSRGDNSWGTDEASATPCQSQIIGPAFPPGFKPQNTSDYEETDIIGPALPPGLKVNDQVSSDEDTAIGPALPPGFKGSKQAESEDSAIGPALPPRLSHSRNSSDDESASDSDSDSGVMGPALPPGFKINANTAPVKGPSLPPGGFFQNKSDVSDDEDDYIVGPLPTEMDRSGRSTVVEEFEQRASTMKDKLTKTEEAAPVRETWMTELPPEMGVDLGLSARKFRSKPTTRGEDRSCWTDTPADKARKAQEAGSGMGKSSREKPAQQNPRDLRIAEQVENYNKKKRKDTLLEMHQEDRKKLKAEEPDKAGPAERRPFDRDLDLQVNRFDDAMRKSVIKKSQQLNTRFSHGSNSQFL